MRSWLFFGLLSATGRIALTQANESLHEPTDFDVTAALKNLGIDVSEIPALNGFDADAPTGECSLACGSLSNVFGLSKVSSLGALTYQNFTGSFWSAQQGEVLPYCVFQPSTSKEVSIAVLLARLTDCPFAAKSGGHAAFAGASNAPAGISIWLKNVNDISLNEDKSVASIGPGNTWRQVYQALEPHGLAVVGGRASTIGVGGFVLGGGISFYANLYGWAIDNVQSFEVVTASGDIVTASETESPDLYWALRGGGNNFGLVTKFNLYTIPSPMMRGGARTFAEEHIPDAVNAFVNVINDAPTDGNAQHWVAFMEYQGRKLASAELAYTKDVEDPEIFKKYRSIPAVADTTTSKTLVQYCEDVEAHNPFGLREVYWTISAQLNEELAKWAVDEFFKRLPQVANVSSVMPVMVYQAVTEPILEKMSKFGGNSLGFDPSKGPVHILLLACWWDNKAEDEVVYGFMESLSEAVLSKSQAMGVENDYIYMNYASQFQDVISGYGAANKARLQEIASKYDPEGVYQKLQPGYFKLGGAPRAFGKPTS